MGFLDNIGTIRTSAFSDFDDTTNLNLRWLPRDSTQLSFKGFNTSSPLNIYGKMDSMDGSVPVGTEITQPVQSAFTMNNLGKYGKVAGQWAQPIGLGLNAYSTFFGQGKKAFDKNMTLLDQQIADNKDKLQRRSALNEAWARTERRG